MKLRIRSLESKETLKIEIPTPSPLQILKDSIAEKISANSSQNLHISLNRKDELISCSTEESLQSLGITSGDLIFYSLNPSAFSNSPVQSPIPPSNPAPSKILESEPTHENKTLTLPKEAETMVVDQETETPMDEDVEMEMEMEMESENSNPFPCFLKKVFKGEANDEVLMVALHAVLLESGFVPFDSSTQKKIDGFHLPSTHTSLHYTIPDLLISGNVNKFETVIFKFHNLGKFFNVYGSLNKKSANVYRLCLDKTRFVPSISFACANFASSTDVTDVAISFHVKEVFEFWKIVKDRLALSLLIDLCEIAGLSLPPCFTRLPIDIKLRILELLPGVDIAKVCCVSSELKFLSSNNNLWKQKVVEEFPQSRDMQIDNWKKQFVSCLMDKRRASRVHMRPRRPVAMPMPHRFGFPSRRGRGPYGFPGIVGGDYDRFPAPFGSNPAPLPGLHFPARRTTAHHLCNLGGFDA